MPNSSQPASIDPNAPKRKLKTESAKNFNANYVRPKKRSKKPFIIGGVIFMVIALIIISLIPKKGGIYYGLCKSFVELNDPYPQSLEWVMAYESGTAVILDYNKTDAFGARTLNQIRCFFKDGGNNKIELDRVKVNGKTDAPLGNQTNIDRFNRGIIALIKHPPDLTLPSGLPQNVKDYK